MKRVKGEESEESDLDKQDEKFEQRSKNAIFFFLRGLGDRRLFVVPTSLLSVTGTSMANKKMLRLKGGGMGLMSVQNDHSVQGWVMTLSVSPTDSSSARFP